MIILGIDPGLATTGYGLIRVQKEFQKSTDKFELVDYGCLVTGKELTESNRLEKLYLDMKLLLQEYKPDLLTIERLFFFKNAKTIISVGQARGVVILAASRAKVPVVEYAPLQVKSILVGYGRAKKKEVEKEVKKILNKKILKLNKDQKTKDGHHLDDAVDALAVAICHTLLVKKDK